MNKREAILLDFTNLIDLISDENLDEINNIIARTHHMITKTFGYIGESAKRVLDTKNPMTIEFSMVKNDPSAMARRIVKFLDENREDALLSNLTFKVYTEEDTVKINIRPIGGESQQ